MAIRFDWKSVPVDLQLEAPPDGAPPPVVGVVQLPDLSGFPDPLDKTHVLLEAAAQVEHMLLIQYLYAALTLKSGDALAALQAPQQAAVRQWRRSLMDIAIEEMGHLMTVQNLRLFSGADPIFDREAFPPKVDVYPFKMHLEPLTAVSLAKYVLAESPFSEEPSLEKYRKLVGTTPMVRHVGVIYGLLAVLFSAPETLPPPDSTDVWDLFVREVADKCGALATPHEWHVPADLLHPESETKQADTAHFFTDTHPGFFFEKVTTAAAARAVVKRIGVQGEAPVVDSTASHYRRFRVMFEGDGAATIGFPEDGSFVAAFDVDTDPQLSALSGEALKVAQEVDDAYAAMLQDLVAYFTATADRGPLADSALSHMTTIRSRANKLATLLQSETSTRHASPIFSLPR